MIQVGIWALATGLGLLFALLCHRYVRAWLPEDHPRGGRKNHPRPTPMLGSVVATALAVGALLAGAWWTLGAILIAAGCGLWDDARKDAAGRAEAKTGDPTWQLEAGISWRTKTVLLGLTSLLLALGGPGPIGFHLLWTTGLTFVVINAVNFLDNTDGVAGGIVAAGALGWVAWGTPSAADDWALMSAGVAIGFLACNWPKAQGFLGDGGALALGCALAHLALHTPATLRVPGMAVIAIPLLDFCQVVGVRIWLGIPPWCADRRHLPHMLMHVGVPRIATAPLLAAAAVGSVWALA